MIRLVQNSFFGGQLDYEMMGRQDYQRYAKGATRLCNFNIMKRGGLDKRRGFDRIMDLTTLDGVTANTKFRAIPFAYKKTHGFVLLMSSAKCIVVGTNPVTQFKYYNVDDLDGVYSAEEIQELDYQQCGDELFIAHQNHPPAKITHDIDSLGEDGFHYSQINLTERLRGVPSLTNAYCKRMIVKDDEHNAALFTEKYKVTAVFDGVETFPCPEYSKFTNSPWGTGGWYGTNYPMPWTESQVITLTCTPAGKVADDGTTVYPEEIRFYKKAFNYFGLIGVKKVSSPITIAAPTSLSLPTTISNIGGTASVEALSDVNAEVPSYGVGYVGHQLGTTKKSFSATTSISGHLAIQIGCTYYQVESDKVTFRYVGWTAGKIKVRHGTNLTTAGQYTETEASLPASIGNKTYVCNKNVGESAADFAARWADEYSVFCNELRGATEINVPFSHTKTGTLFDICTASGEVYITNIKVNNYGAIGTVNFDDNYITPDSSTTPPEYDEGNPMFSGEGNYPASVSLSQQRLIWASTKNDPARVWLSETGDFYTYSNHEIQVASDPIDFTLPVTRFAKINHICEMRKLLMFNSACEWLVDSASSVQGLTYETIQAYPQSYSGSAERLKPIICNNSLIFCERTGQAVRRFAYDISNDGFAGRDVSVLSASIFENNSIVDWTYQQFPYSTLWCAMADGNMASFEFMEEQDIMAWMTHKLGGNGKVVCLATSYAVSPAMDEVQDVDVYGYATHEEVFAVVKRGSALWLERMRVRSRPAEDGGNCAKDTIYHSLCLDGCRVLNSTNGFQPTQEEGAIWIPEDTEDGTPIDRNVALAKIQAGVEVYEGFPFDAVYESVYPNVNNGNIGYGQFDIKHVQGIGLRLMYAYGGKVRAKGSEFDEPIPYFYNDPENDHKAKFVSETEGQVSVRKLALYNHDTNIMSLSGVNNRDGRVIVTQSDPFPFGLLSYEIDFEPEVVSYGRSLL